MNWVQMLQDTLSRRRRRRPARRRRFSDRFLADLIIKPLESRFVLSGNPVQQELVLSLSGSGNLVVSDAAGTHNDAVTVQAGTQHSQYIITELSQPLDIGTIAGATLSQDGHTAFV